MVAAMESGAGRKQKTGKVLFAVGSAALFLQLWSLWLEATTAWSHAAAASLGWLGALGIATLQFIDFVAWNPNGILLSVAKLLLLFCPVAMMIGGVLMLRRAN